MKNALWVMLLTIVVSISMFERANAQDWPQFLGPDRNSISPQKGLLRSWPEEGPEVLWSVNVNIGFGGPVVKDGKVYLLDRDDETGDMMRCFDLQTGAERWKLNFDSPGTRPFPGSQSVPIVDDRHVYACGPNGNLYCIDIQSSKLIWSKNVWTDFGGEKIPMWGISQCPLIYKDLLVISSQAPNAGVVAFDKLTGNVIWQTPNLGYDAYVSPAIANIHGEDHIVMISSSTNTYTHPNAEMEKGNVVGIDPQTGKIRWKYANWNCAISIPGAVDAGNNKLLIVGGYELGATMIQVHKTADGAFETSEIFTTEDFGDQTKPPLLYNDHFYAIYTTNSKREGLICMNMDGEIMWKTRRDPNFDRGSLILADGLLLATDGNKMLYLIEPDPTAFKPVSKAELLGGTGEDAAIPGIGTQNWAPIALADGKLLIRNKSKMYCIKVAK